METIICEKAFCCCFCLSHVYMSEIVQKFPRRHRWLPPAVSRRYWCNSRLHNKNLLPANVQWQREAGATIYCLSQCPTRLPPSVQTPSIPLDRVPRCVPLYPYSATSRAQCQSPRLHSTLTDKTLVSVDPSSIQFGSNFIRNFLSHGSMCVRIYNRISSREFNYTKLVIVSSNHMATAKEARKSLCLTILF